MGLGHHQLRIPLSSTQLKTPIAHFPGSLRSQSMDTIQRDTGDVLNLFHMETSIRLSIWSCRRLRRARVRMPAAPLTVRTEAGSADLVPMRPPRPGFPWLHHGPIGQLCILQTEMRRLRLCR